MYIQKFVSLVAYRLSPPAMRSAVFALALLIALALIATFRSV